MRLNTTCLILIGFITTITSCSHPQVRDASQLDADDTKALLEPICGETQAASGCSACPAFLDAEEKGPLTVERVLHGSFSYDGADEALVEVSGCGGHDVVALERHGGKWHRFGWQQNLSLGECEQVERDGGTTGLVCHTPPEMHSQRKDVLEILGVKNGKLARDFVRQLMPPASCEQHLNKFGRIGKWKLGSDRTTVHFELEAVCQRTRPHQTLCEARQKGIDPVSRLQIVEFRIDWTAISRPGRPLYCDIKGIETVVSANAKKFEQCVAVGGQEASTGMYIPAWTIGSDGAIKERTAALQKAPTDNPAVSECFQRVVSAMKFEKIDGGTCVVNFPLFFKNGTYWRNACPMFDPPPLEWLEARGR